MFRFGLYGGGAVAKSLVARIPSLGIRLGPVAASSVRVASRITNSMGAGQPAASCDELDECRHLLVCVPGDALAASVEALRDARVNWRRVAVLVCDTPGDSRALAALRQRGAATGSLNPVPGTIDRFVMEGDREPVRLARWIVKEVGGRAIELGTEQMDYYAAGLALASGLFTPLIAACAECLTAAGCPQPEAVELAGLLMTHTLRNYANAGRNSWAGISALPAVEMQNGALARYCREAATFAEALLGPR